MTARGPFGAVDGFSVKRANTGMYLVGIGAGQELDRLVFENCEIGSARPTRP